MSKLTLLYNSLSDTIELFFTNEELQGFLSSLPQKTRTWNKKDRCWVIVPEAICKVVGYSRHLFSYIDCSALPERYQREVHDSLSGILKDGTIPPGANYGPNIGVVKGNNDKSPYSILYITSDAPDFIVKSVFKSLVLKYHPDTGGNVDKFREVMKAHDKIKELRGW
jgi:hypothetical protein